MPYLLEDLVIDRVDLVDEGANSAAFISLYKRKERGDTMELKEILEKMKPEHSAAVQTELDRLSGEVTKANETAATLTGKLTKAEEDLQTVNDDLAKATSELKTLKQTEQPSEEEAILKALPEAARELLAKMKTQKEAAEETLRKSKEAEETTKAVAKAAELKALPIAQDKLVDIVKSCSPELLDVLSTINTAIEGTVLGEVGKNKPGDAAANSQVAWDKIEAKAGELAKTKGISKAKAIAVVIDENPQMYKEYLEGGAN